MTTHLADLLKDSAYRLTQFKAEYIDALEQSITLKATAKQSDLPPRAIPTILPRIRLQG